MRESARVAASIELLAECEASWRTPRALPADIVLHHYFKSRRFIGSKDRGAIAARVYFIIRHYATLQWWAERYEVSGAIALVVAALLLQEKISLPDLHNYFNGEQFAPAKLTPALAAFAKTIAGESLLNDQMPAHVRLNYPQWLDAGMQLSLGPDWQAELAALNQEAPVDLRVNTLLATREQLIHALKQEGYEVEPTPHSPVGVRMKTRAPVFTSEAFKQGWFEMQDEGSQLVTQLLPVKPGDKVIDFCAGAGGKTLALAASMKNKGRILAWDTSEKRLLQMPPRLKRAKVDNVQRHILSSESDPFIKRHKDSADAVLVDAPCSGCGTWRRNPDLKWRFQPTGLEEVLMLQQNILLSASRLVKRGGHLLYVTCSLLQNENESQLEQFLKTQEKFKVVLPEKIWNNVGQQTIKQGGMFRLTPHQDGTDGFFAALLQRCE